jgi:hypothetical protein
MTLAEAVHLTEQHLEFALHGIWANLSTVAISSVGRRR